MALVDEARSASFADVLPPIGDSFYDQSRTWAFSTASTNTFRYTPRDRGGARGRGRGARRAAAPAANALSANRVRGGPGSGGDGLRPPAALLPRGWQMDLQREDLEAGNAAEPASRRPMPAVNSGWAGPAWERGMGGNMPGQNVVISSDMFRAEDSKSEDAGPGAGAEAPPTRLACTTASSCPVNRPDGANRATPPRPATVSPRRPTGTPPSSPAADGKARITFKAPTALSEYKFSARGVTAADTLVGQGGGTLAVKKDFFVDLDLPPAFTEGDRPRPMAQVHHVGIKGRAALTLVVYAGGRESDLPEGG